MSIFPLIQTFKRFLHQQCTSIAKGHIHSLEDIYICDILIFSKLRTFIISLAAYEWLGFPHRASTHEKKKRWGGQRSTSLIKGWD